MRQHKCSINHALRSKSNIPQPAKEEILLTLLKTHNPEDPAKKPQDTPCK